MTRKTNLNVLGGNQQISIVETNIGTDNVSLGLFFYNPIDNTQQTMGIKKKQKTQKAKRTMDVRMIVYVHAFFIINLFKKLFKNSSKMFICRCKDIKRQNPSCISLFKQS